MRRFLLGSLILLTPVLGAGERAEGQEAARKPLAGILREQAKAIAEEILDSLNLASFPMRRVSVSVEGGGAPQIIENAMLETLQRRGFEGMLGTSSRGGRSVDLYVLEQGDLRDSIDKEKTERSVKTTLEARVTEPGGSSRWIGAFSRLDRDTILIRETTGSSVGGLLESGSFFERVVEPLVIVAGVFLIVYLFFTVRS